MFSTKTETIVSDNLDCRFLVFLLNKSDKNLLQRMYTTSYKTLDCGEKIFKWEAGESIHISNGPHILNQMHNIMDCVRHPLLAI